MAHPVRVRVGTVAEFKEAVRAVPVFIEVYEHLDLSATTQGSAYVLLGNCTKQPIFQLPTARTTASQCVLLVLNEGFFESFQGDGLSNIYLLVSASRGPSSTAAHSTQDNLPAVLRVRHRSLNMQDVVIHANNFQGRALVMVNGRLACLRCHFLGFHGIDGMVLWFRSATALLWDSTFSTNFALVDNSSLALSPQPTTSLVTALHANEDVMPMAVWLQNCTLRNNRYTWEVRVQDADAVVYTNSKKILILDSEFHEQAVPFLVGEVPVPGEPATMMNPLAFLSFEYLNVYHSAEWRESYPVIKEFYERRNSLEGPVQTPKLGPAHRAVSTSAELRSSLRLGVAHITVKEHLDLVDEASRFPSIGCGHQTRSIVGQCLPADATAARSLARPQLPRQCILDVNGTAIHVTGTHSSRLWIARLYFRIVTQDATVSGGRMPGVDPFIQSQASIIGVPDMELGVVTYRQLAPTVYLARAELWATDCVFDGTATSNISAVSALYSRVYMRGSSFVGFTSAVDYTRLVADPDHHQAGAPLQVQSSNVTLHACAFYNNVAHQLDVLDHVAPGVRVMQNRDNRGSVVWVYSGTFENNSLFITPALDVWPLPDPCSRPGNVPPPYRHSSVLGNLSRTWSKLSVPISTVETIGNHAVRTSIDGLQVYATEENQVVPAPSINASDADGGRLSVMNEDNPWFATIVQEYSMASGRPREHLQPMPEFFRSESLKSGAHMGKDWPILTTTVTISVAALILLLLAAVAFAMRWRNPAGAEAVTSTVGTSAKEVAAGDIVLEDVVSRPSTNTSASQTTFVTNSEPSVQDVYRTPCGGHYHPCMPAGSSAPLHTQQMPSHHSRPSSINGNSIPTILALLDDLCTSQSLFLQSFRLQPAVRRRIDRYSVCQDALREHDDLPVVLKLFCHSSALEYEMMLHNTPALLPLMPQLLFSSSGAVEQVTSGPIGSTRPVPFVVLEHEEQLPHWIVRVEPDVMMIVSILCQLLKILEVLHSLGFCHGNLCPENVLRRRSTDKWVLTGFTLLECDNCEGAKSPRLAYCAPEVATADHPGALSHDALAAADMWSFGAIAIELLTAKPMLSNDMDREHILKCLSGEAALPWEITEGEQLLRRLGELRTSILSCVQREPEYRPAASELACTWAWLLQHPGNLQIAKQQYSPWHSR